MDDSVLVGREQFFDKVFMQYPEPIQNLINHFTRFPGVGPRTAARYVFYLLKSNPKRTEEFQRALAKLHQNTKTCNFCFKSYEDDGQDLCEICRDQTRDQSKLCIVEKEADLLSIEETKAYDGLYFILGGTLSTLNKDKAEQEIRAQKLGERIIRPKSYGIDTNIKEIIIATNPTTEGDATALYLERKLEDLNKKVTRLGRGMPVGGELEYADEETLSSALKSRR